MCGSANRSLAHIEPVSAVPKRKSENTEQRPPPQMRVSSAAIPEKLCRRLARPALSPENAAGSRKQSMCPTETGMVGCGCSLQRTRSPDWIPCYQGNLQGILRLRSPPAPIKLLRSARRSGFSRHSKLARPKIEQGIFGHVSGNYQGMIREFSARIRESL